MAEAADGTIDASDHQVGSNPPGLLETELFIPRYRPIRSGRWEVRISGAGIVPSYWGSARLALKIPILLRDGEC